MKTQDTYWEDCGQCRGDEVASEDCDLCGGCGRVERCCTCKAAIDPRDGGACFYCDIIGERPEPTPAAS